MPSAMASYVENILALAFKGLLRLIAWLPLRVSRALGRGVGLLLSFGNSKFKQLTSENIARCYPQLNSQEQAQLVKDSLQETTTLIFELAGTWLWDIKKCESFIKSIHNAEILDAAFKNKQGVIIALPHLGNWEIIGAYLGIRYPTTALYKPPKRKIIEQFIIDARERYQLTMAPTNARGILKLVKALQRGEVVVILPDQVPDKNTNAIDVNFMNTPARTMLLIHKLLQKTSATLVGAAAIRNQSGFDIHFEQPSEAIYSEHSQASAIELNLLVEKMIALAPAQYQWEYNRFKHHK